VAFNQFDVPAQTIALTSATTKTVVGVKAAGNIVVKCTEVSASFDGATSTNAPVVVEFCQNTFGANPPGTNSTSVTPSKRDAGRAETIQATAGKNWTTEPTTQAQQRVLDVGQYNGTFVYMNPFASPHIIVGGAGANVRVTSPTGVNYSGGMVCEE
jgi:hypothetical protein